jgi:cytochrome P450
MYRMFMLNSPAVHTTSISACNFFLHLLSCPPEKRALESVAEETREIWEGYTAGTWSAADLRKAVLLDSAVKESLRMHGLNAIGSSRRVSASTSVLFHFCGEPLFAER